MWTLPAAPTSLRAAWPMRAGLGRHFGTSVRFWLNLQAAFDAEEVARGPVAKAVARIVPCRPQRAEA